MTMRWSDKTYRPFRCECSSCQQSRTPTRQIKPELLDALREASKVNP